MSQLNNRHKKESNLWIIGMISVVIGIILFVAIAIFIQHQQLAAEAVAATSTQK